MDPRGSIQGYGTGNPSWSERHGSIYGGIVESSFSEMIAKIQEACKLLEDRRKQALKFLAVFRRRVRGAEQIDLVVSAPWLDSQSLRSIQDVIEDLKGSLSDAEIADISRIVIADPDDAELTALIRRLPQVPVRLENFVFAGVRVKSAVILVAAHHSPTESYKPRKIRPCFPGSADAKVATATP